MDQTACAGRQRDDFARRLHPHQIVELWKVNKPGQTEAALLAQSHSYIGATFGHDGAFIDSNGAVTSEAQSYAMLRAVWTNDRPTFDRTWNWTQQHLLTSDGLLSWLWQGGKVVDPNSATDGDTDTALALLMAGKRWNDPALHAAGVRMMQAIWEHEVTEINGRPYITAGNWATDATVVALNPSYFSPYAYRIFQEVDPGTIGTA